MLHVDSEIFSTAISDIDPEYGNMAKTNITWCKTHKYLGMTINYYPPGKVILSTVYYIGKMIDDTPEYMRGEFATSSAISKR